ncbi:MAG: YhjD/YihY/BrkB family envelope integrity protein [Polyangiales bacterium]
MASKSAGGFWGRLDKVFRFFSQVVWETRLDELPNAQAFRYRTARIAHTTIRGLLFEDALHVRAAALTYFTVLSIVPLLAFVFAILKGFGAYNMLVEQTIRPGMVKLFDGNPPLRIAVEQILDFVAQTGVTSLGLVGLLTLLYAATRLLRNIETALNEIWGVSEARGALEQVRDYMAMIVITPICLMGAAALTTVGQALNMLRAAGKALGLSGILEPLIGVLGPLAVLFIGLGALYVVMPNTRVRTRSAIIGAVIGGTVWYGVLVAHVKFQVGVARFNALYSSFGAIPIFLAWLQISWLVILLGAQIAATHQHSQKLAQHKRLIRADQALREAVCLSAMLSVTRAFLNGSSPPTLSRLSSEHDTPETVLSEWLDRLVDAGWLIKAHPQGELAYVLAVDPERVHVKDVLDALRRAPGASSEDLGRSMRVDPAAADVWLELDRSIAESPVNRTFRALVEEEPS